jgi:hypothetical protein
MPAAAVKCDPALSAGGQWAAMILCYAGFASCFAMTCFTNDVILSLVRQITHRGADWPTGAGRHLAYATADYYDQFLLESMKGCAFFVCLIIFGLLLRRSFLSLWPAIARRRLWTDVMIGLLIASIFLFELLPNGMGRIYGYVSVEPFLQHQGFYHRRILMPLLAHNLHLDGVLYVFFYWAMALAVFALTKIYVESRGVLLSRLEMASLFTTGIFASALGLPGYVEILVLGLTLLAMLDHDRNGRSSIVQPVLFGLALLTHESAAILAFGTLALTYFDRKFLPHFAALLGLYLVIWLASYGFDVSKATAVQFSGGKSNLDQFLRTAPLVLFSLLAAYKLVLLAAVAAASSFVSTGRYRLALLILLGLGGSIALTAIATDYTRMMAFGSFAMLVALPVALKPLTARTRLVLATANLLLPTLYVAAHHGALTYHGLYGLVLTRWFGMRG